METDRTEKGLKATQQPGVSGSDCSEWLDECGMFCPRVFGRVIGVYSGRSYRSP